MIQCSSENMVSLFRYSSERFFVIRKQQICSMFFGGPNWQVNKQTKFGSRLFCVSVFVWTGWDWYFIFRGIKYWCFGQLYVYYLTVAKRTLDENRHCTYLYWWNVIWFIGENTISNHGTLITPSGFRAGKQGHQLLPDQRDVKIARGLFFSTAQSSVPRVGTSNIHLLPEWLSCNAEYRPSNLNSRPQTEQLPRHTASIDLGMFLQLLFAQQTNKCVHWALHVFKEQQDRCM